MGTIFSKIQELFGQELQNSIIKEALTYPNNSSLAKIGDTVLDLINHTTAYNEKYTPEMMAKFKETSFTKVNHTKLVNDDKEFVRYLLDNDYEEYTAETIGIERSDAYLEAILGAIWMRLTPKEAYLFVMEVYS
jgi:hypothetical protein